MPASAMVMPTHSLGLSTTISAPLLLNREFVRGAKSRRPASPNANAAMATAPMTFNAEIRPRGAGAALGRISSASVPAPMARPTSGAIHMLAGTAASPGALMMAESSARPLNAKAMPVSQATRRDNPDDRNANRAPHNSTAIRMRSALSEPAPVFTERFASQFGSESPPRDHSIATQVRSRVGIAMRRSSPFMD